MKVAILGSSPVALEAALRFHAHGAAITWFNLEDDLYHQQSIDMDWKDAVSSLGEKLLGKEFTKLNYQQWLASYFHPLESLLKNEGQRVKPFEVVAITKSRLAPGEEIPGKTRFHDLFRVIYEIDPQNFINEQKDSDPSLFKRLNDEVVHSLQSKIEMYEDMDLVIDCRRPNQPLSLNINGRALGEKRIRQGYLFSGLDALKKSKEDKSNYREVAIVGNDDLTAEMILHFSQWLDDSRMRLFIVSHESTPLESFLQTAKADIAEKLRSFFDRSHAEFIKETEDFMQKLRQWQELDDFVQVKIPRPTEPIPRLVFFMAHNACAIDQLIDNKRIFLTLETSDFRESKIQAENNQLDLKTIGVDCVLVSNGFSDQFNILEKNELGYFRIRPQSLLTNGHWQTDLGELNEIEGAIFKLFSPA